jgi:hypothetical protein
MIDRIEIYFQKVEVFASLAVGSLMAMGASLQQLIEATTVESGSLSSQISSEILGPLGALALSIVVLYFAIQAIKALVARNDRLAKEHQELYAKMVDEKNKEIEELKRLLNDK